MPSYVSGTAAGWEYGVYTRKGKKHKGKKSQDAASVRVWQGSAGSGRKGTKPPAAPAGLLAGVFDGHGGGGEEVAHFAATEMFKDVVPTAGSAAAEVQRIDDALIGPPLQWEEGGTTAALAAARPDGRVLCVHVGDSRVVVARPARAKTGAPRIGLGKMLFATTDHCAWGAFARAQPSEKARVTAAGMDVKYEQGAGGGTVSSEASWLSMSRALGDSHFKQYKGSTLRRHRRRFAVTAEAGVAEVACQPGDCVVIVSDGALEDGGLSKAGSISSAALAREACGDVCEHGARYAAQAAGVRAFKRGSWDDITCAVLRYIGPPGADGGAPTGDALPAISSHVAEVAENEKLLHSGHCPAGHALTVFNTEEDGFRCNTCLTMLEKGARLCGCRKCDWDVCTACAPQQLKKVVQQTSKSSLKKVVQQQKKSLLQKLVQQKKVPMGRKTQKAKGKTLQAAAPAAAAAPKDGVQKATKCRRRCKTQPPLSQAAKAAIAAAAVAAEKAKNNGVLAAAPPPPPKKKKAPPPKEKVPPPKQKVPPPKVAAAPPPKSGVQKAPKCRRRCKTQPPLSQAKKAAIAAAAVAKEKTKKNAPLAAAPAAVAPPKAPPPKAPPKNGVQKATKCRRRCKTQPPLSQAAKAAMAAAAVAKEKTKNGVFPAAPAAAAPPPPKQKAPPPKQKLPPPKVAAAPPPKRRRCKSQPPLSQAAKAASAAAAAAKEKAKSEFLPAAPAAAAAPPPPPKSRRRNKPTAPPLSQAAKAAIAAAAMAKEKAKK